jgi:penicillin-binding protein 1A
VQGGSTITMQVAEDVVLGHSRALSQKFREWLLAYRLERELTKDEILGLYLNNIFLGHGRFGVDEAARFYFGKRAAGLDAAESALLAGIIASPERYSPRRSPELALRRRAYVLGQMQQKGFITPDLYADLMATPLKLAPAAQDNASLSPEAVAVARRALSGLRKDGHVNERYRIETTIDPRLQAAARTAVVDALSAYAGRHRLKPPFVSSSVKAWGKPFQGEPRRHRIYVGVVDSVDDQAGVVRVQVGDMLGEVKLRD